MANARLHLDADTSSRALQKVLAARGHDVTRTPNAWMPFDASDEQQLLGATAQGRCIFTYNIGDFMQLARKFPEHGGIVLAQQRDWSLAQLIAALDDMLTGTTAAEWLGQVRWLTQWQR